MLSQLLDRIMNSDAFRLDVFPATIGRSTEAAVCIEDRFSSRLHCVIECSNDEFQVTDLGSQHGTFVNGERITQTKLVSGDTLQIGLHHYRVNRVGRRLLFRVVHPSIYHSAMTCPADNQMQIDHSQGRMAAQI